MSTCRVSGRWIRQTRRTTGCWQPSPSSPPRLWAYCYSAGARTFTGSSGGGAYRGSTIHNSPPEISELPVAEAADQVVVHQAGPLHERVTDRWPDEVRSTRDQILAQRA